MITKRFIPWLFAIPPPTVRPAGTGAVDADTGGSTALGDQLVADAEEFVKTFGEIVVYTPLGGEGRNILAVVDRRPAAGGRASRARIAVAACNRQTAISDDEVGGIGSSEVDQGGDTVTLARRLKTTATVLQLTAMVRHDEGMVNVEIG